MSAGDLSALYQQLILDHAKDPEGRGDTSEWRFRSHQVNTTCGDEVTFAIARDGDAITGSRWEGHGCAISQASASLLSGLLEGRTAGELTPLIEEFRTVLRSRGQQELDEERFGDAVALSGVSRYVARVKCAMLPWVALEHALAQSAAESRET